MKRVHALLVALVLCAHTNASAAPRSGDLLRAMVIAGRTVSYTAVETVTAPGVPTVISTVRRHGLRQRVEYSSPPIMKGDVLVDDGTNIWRYHRAEKSVVKTKTIPQYSAADLRYFALHFEANTLGPATVNTRKAWVVAIFRKGKKQPLRKFWIDEKSKIRLRSEQFSDRGQRTETRVLTHLHLVKVPASAFGFTTPPGVRITNAGMLYTRLHQAQRHARWLRVPARVPRGYAFESVVLDAKKQESWLRYTNGLRRFSIFQQRMSEQASTPLSRAGNGWFWQRAGNRFLIAGLPEAQARQVAASTR